MASATVGMKGRVTIPRQVRSQLGLAAGDRIDFVRNDETGRYELIPANRRIKALKGIVAAPARPISVEDMNLMNGRRGSASR
ncbi:AbrB/MazE/SpoVT family DNA-binding domain-containing protein [Paraburkholderia sp. Ac-20336]|uniref:AbrB/MazE/SpoVT family DNA-binding domain-containing protein n=1 Tax=Paraburkholderia sp. Ac-20336 TaxID=2703886 RepID=UPI00197DEB58|nr:AbrB/MazE/SpoVT family DNA-binding domain-containing protein [Paraburkholderia sp. Ac-20336]MBN3804154.1 AbrB/MazE/SpoVT family DNA-binding domain-containing protein [Paraburkholderia sp. Ac-20336]